MEKFTCSICEETFELAFRHLNGMAYIINKDGFASEELEHYEICKNCRPQLFERMNPISGSSVNSEEDLPF